MPKAPDKPLDPQAVAAASEAMPDRDAEQRIRENLDALCSPVRVKILRALAQAELAAGDLAIVIDRSRSATSQHLHVLRQAGIVVSTRSGNVVRYRLADGVTPEILSELAMRLDAA